MLAPQCGRFHERKLPNMVNGLNNKKLLLIDGSSVLSSSFFGTVPMAYTRSKTDDEREAALLNVLKSPDGRYVNGVYTMMRTLEKIFNNQKPTHVAVAWDISRNTFRRELFPDYKAHRKDTRPELSSQFGVAQSVFESMSIPQFMFKDYEADDIIGTFSRRFSSDIGVRILTKDQDALQLASNTSFIWLMTSKAKDMYSEMDVNVKDHNLPSNVFEHNPMTIEMFYGVHPSMMVDKKALEGDTSDNIPGVHGIGEKASVPLLKEFGTIEHIYDYIDATDEKDAKIFFKELGISRSPIGALTKASDETRIHGREAASLSKKLGEICCDIDSLANVSLDSLELRISQDGRRESYRTLGFSSML
jgi:5'-3' exonuclease